MTTLLYALLAVAIVYLIFSPYVMRKLSGARPVSPRQAFDMLEKGEAVALDIRGEAVFAGGHVPGSINIPLDELKTRFAEIGNDRDRPVIICCGTGNQSGDAATILRRRDYRALYNLDGGILKWRRTGLPLDTKPLA